MRIIDADELLQKMQTEYDSTDRLIDQGELHLDTLAEGYTEVHMLIENCPTIDPESLMPHGRWKTKRGNYYATGGGNPIWGCSNCDFIYGASMSSPKWDFCPNCGAKMKKEG